MLKCWSMEQFIIPECLVMASFFNFSKDWDGEGNDDGDRSVSLPLTDFWRVNGPGELPFTGTFFEPKLPWLESWGYSDLFAMITDKLAQKYLPTKTRFSWEKKREPSTIGQVTFKSEFQDGNTTSIGWTLHPKLEKYIQQKLEVNYAKPSIIKLQGAILVS